MSEDVTHPDLGKQTAQMDVGDVMKREKKNVKAEIEQTRENEREEQMLLLRMGTLFFVTG